MQENKNAEIERRLRALKCSIIGKYGINSIHSIEVVDETTFEVVLKSDLRSDLNSPLNGLLRYRVYKKEPNVIGRDVVKVDNSFYYVWMV